MRYYIDIVENNQLLEEGVSERIWFHGTSRNFDQFSNAFTSGQLGIHLGSTMEQATWRLGDENGMVLRVRANVTKLIRLNDEGSWYGEAFVEQLRNNPLTRHIRWNGSMSDRTIAHALSNLGFEGVIYKNMFEGESHTPSIIVFDVRNLKIVGREMYRPEIEDR